MANDDLTTIKTNLASLLTAMLASPASLSGLPSDAVPIHGTTAADITDTSVVAIIAAPAAGKALYISKLIINNKTIAEDPIITVQDGAGTPVVIAKVMPSTAGGNGGNAVFDFNPPVKLTTAKALNGKASAATGDVMITAVGWSGSA